MDVSSVHLNIFFDSLHLPNIRKKLKKKRKEKHLYQDEHTKKKRKRNFDTFRLKE